MLTDADPNHSTIHSILKKYKLSFRYPFIDESQKKELSIKLTAREGRISMGRGLEPQPKKFLNFAKFRGRNTKNRKNSKPSPKLEITKSVPKKNTEVIQLESPQNKTETTNLLPKEKAKKDTKKVLEDNTRQ